MKVLLDTNILMLFDQGIDPFAAIERALDERFSFLLLEEVMEELVKLSKKKSKDGRAAKLGLSIVNGRLRSQQSTFLERLLLPSKEIPLKKARTSGKVHTDDAIVAIAEDDPKIVVATLDKGLQGRLLKRNIRVLSLRQKEFRFMR